jgi:hypothetical protein
MSAPRNAVDAVLDELHELRLTLDAQFDHDPEKFLAYVREGEQQLLREGWVEAPPSPPVDVRRVRQALARARRNPHLLECGEDRQCAGGEDDRGTDGSG